MICGARSRSIFCPTANTCEYHIHLLVPSFWKSIHSWCQSCVQYLSGHRSQIGRSWDLTLTSRRSVLQRLGCMLNSNRFGGEGLGSWHFMQSSRPRCCLRPRWLCRLSPSTWAFFRLWWAWHLKSVDIGGNSGNYCFFLTPFCTYVERYTVEIYTVIFCIYVYIYII